MESIKTDEKPVLEGRCLTKQFYGNIVLDNVDILCKPGTILALAGENGAGKSTLMNIICGNLTCDKGTINFKENELTGLNPQKAKELGIAFVHQELSLLPGLSVGENIMLGQEAKKYFWFISHKKTHEKAEEILDELQYQVDVSRLVRDLSPAEKQMVEIAKAWVNRPEVLVLDEPTSSLSKKEVEHLFKMMKRLKENGTSIIFITHRMDEIFQICDEVVVLKDGKLMKTERVDDITRDELIQSMVGREITQTFPPRRNLGNSYKNLLQLENIFLEGHLKNINLEVPEGHIIGIGGLEGQGQRQLARGLFGINKFSDGSIIYKDEEMTIDSPLSALKHNIGFIPDNRTLEGLVLPLSVRENITLLILDNISRSKILLKENETEEVQKGIERLSIKADSIEQKVRFLSGGNQQKVIFSKWIKMEPELLILHEPTRGVDIQSKIEIYHLLRELTLQGISILLFSSDMLELIGLSDKIYVMYEGQIIGDIRGEVATEEAIMTLSSGKKLE